MIRLVISNQRGGVAKTTTTHTFARHFADQGLRVLIIDTDPQGSVGTVLGLKPHNYLHQFIIHHLLFKDCVVEASPGIDVLCSNRETVQTEAILMGSIAREMTFENVFSPVEKAYDAVLIDVAPSINLLQTCSMIYAKQMVIPVAMDPLSLQGAVASIETARTLNALFKTNIRPIVILPVMVDRRLQMTEVIMESLKDLSARLAVPLLQPIRTDSTVTKCTRSKQFLVDYDSKCKAMEDYQIASRQLLELLKEQTDGRQLEVSAQR